MNCFKSLPSGGGAGIILALCCRLSNRVRIRVLGGAEGLRLQPSSIDNRSGLLHGISSCCECQDICSMPPMLSMAYPERLLMPPYTSTSAFRCIWR